MDIRPAHPAKTQVGVLLMIALREPVEISKNGKRVAVIISPEEYENYTQLKLQSLKAILAESLAQAEQGKFHSIDDVFSPLTPDELEGKAQG